MPPHCDTKDGPVVKAAKKAISTGDIKYILPWASKESESEIKKAFKLTLKVRKLNKDASEIADTWFFETVVRLHRAGEGAGFTGLKPAGLDEGPVVPRAERSIEKSDPKEVISFLQKTLENQLKEMFRHVVHRKKFAEKDVDHAREYVETMLGFILFSHHLYLTIIKGDTHREKKETSGHEH